MEPNSSHLGYYDRVHEKDYGEPAFASATFGLLQIIGAIIIGIVNLVRRSRGRHRA